MFIYRLILGFGIGFCLGSASRIGAEVKRRGAWCDRDAHQYIARCFMAIAGMVLFAASYA